MNTTMQKIETLAPEIAAIAAAIDPKIAGSIKAAEDALTAFEPLFEQYQVLKAAKTGVDPALWDQIVASNNAADAAVVADAPSA